MMYTSSNEPDRRRVLHVMGTLLPSGMEMMFLSSAEEWARLGYECDIVGPEREIGPLSQRLRDAGYGIFHIPFRGRKRYLFRAGFFREFYRLCTSGYDVLHIHTEAITPIFSVLGKLAGIRVIALTPHSIFRFHGLLRLRKYMERWFIRRLGGRYGMISEGVRRCEWELYRNPGVRTWNWLDTERFRPPTPEERASARQAIGCNEERFVLLSVANCHAIKNHPAIFHAVAILPASLRCEYLHVGREQQGRPEETLAQELGIAAQVRFFGSQTDPIPFFWAADAFVMPSLFEGLGISAIEAIAAGVPSVLAATEGLSDVIAETQWTITCGTSAESVAQGLSELARIPATERMRRAQIDSDLVRKCFSMKRGVRSIVEGLYGAPKQ